MWRICLDPLKFTWFDQQCDAPETIWICFYFKCILCNEVKFLVELQRIERNWQLFSNTNKTLLLSCIDVLKEIVRKTSIGNIESWEHRPIYRMVLNITRANVIIIKIAAFVWICSKIEFSSNFRKIQIWLNFYVNKLWKKLIEQFTFSSNLISFFVLFYIWISNKI